METNDNARCWHDIMPCASWRSSKTRWVSYQQNHTTIARDAKNYGVRRSMWRKLTLSYNDINMAQPRDGSRFVKSSEVSESTQK